MKVTVKVSGVQSARHSLQQVAKQMPFAMSKALNATANSVQSAVRESVAERFTLRKKSFILNTIYRSKSTDFASKSKFSATVRVDPARDVLAQHEEGGIKTPKDGRSIALPTSAVRRTKADLITPTNRPRALLDKPKHFRKGDVLLKETGRGKRRKLVALFVFKRKATIRPRLGFHQTAAKTIDATWEKHATDAVTHALKTMR